MEAKIVYAALIFGIVFGSLMLSSVIYVYIKHKTFGLGGSILTVFGVMLLSLSIWKTVEISVTPKGGIEAKFKALSSRIEGIQEKTNSITGNLEKRVEEIREMTKSTDAKVRKIEDNQVSVWSEIEAQLKKIEHYERFEPDAPDKIAPKSAPTPKVSPRITPTPKGPYMIKPEEDYQKIVPGPEGLERTPSN